MALLASVSKFADKFCFPRRGVEQGPSTWITRDVLQLQTIKVIVNSRRFKGLSSDEPRRVQVLDLYCLTRFESESSGREDVY